MDQWAQRCRGWAAAGRDVYVYFDNDARGRAPGMPSGSSSGSAARCSQRRRVLLAAEVAVEDGGEVSACVLVSGRVREQRHRGTQLDRVDAAEDVDRVGCVEAGERVGALDQP